MGEQVIPPILRMLHEARPGIIHMKSLVRGYVKWPGINKEMETVRSIGIKSPSVGPLHPYVVMVKRDRFGKDEDVP